MRFFWSYFVVAALLSAETRLGRPFTLPGAVPVAAILENPEKYVGRTVQVQGRITEVCRMMGCWMELVDGEARLRVKVNDGEMVFPKKFIGRKTTAEGKLVKITLSREQAVARAKHEAEEMGRKFDPESIKSGETFYQIHGTGAVIAH